MAVKLRLSRVGSKKNPHYRIIAADSRSPRDGRFLEIVGNYNPQTDPSTIKIDKEKAVKWLDNGAEPSEAVTKLLKISGIETRSQKAKKPKKPTSAKKEANSKKVKAEKEKAKPKEG